MASKRAASPFEALKYQKPKGDPGKLAKVYVHDVSKIPEVVEVWGFVDGVTLNLETLIEGDLQTQLKIHENELPASDAYPEVRVNFHVWRQRPDYNWLPHNAVLLYRRPS